MFFLLNPVLFMATNMLLLYTFRRDLFKKFIVFSYINIVKFKIISETYYLDFKQRYLTNKPNKEESVPKELDEDCYLLIYVNPDNTCDEQVCIEEEMMNKDKLKGFYLKNNKILDREFLIWFADRFLNKELHEEYSVNIIDSEANMFQINNNETQVSNSIIL
jgi:hypothetical protein